MHLHTRGAQVRALLEAGSTRITVDYYNKHGENALMVASKLGHAGCVRALVAQGAVVDRENNEGVSALQVSLTPLHLAPARPWPNNLALLAPTSFVAKSFPRTKA